MRAPAWRCNDSAAPAHRTADMLTSFCYKQHTTGSWDRHKSRFLGSARAWAPGSTPVPAPHLEPLPRACTILSRHDQHSCRTHRHPCQTQHTPAPARSRNRTTSLARHEGLRLVWQRRICELRGSWYVEVLARAAQKGRGVPHLLGGFLTAVSSGGVRYLHSHIRYATSFISRQLP